MPDSFPSLEFVLMPGTTETLTRSLKKLERISERMQGIAVSEAVAQKAEVAWRNRNFDYFRSGSGLNRLVSLLLHIEGIAGNKSYQNLLDSIAEEYSSKAAAIALMGWCKVNWFAGEAPFYRKQLNHLATTLELVKDGESKLKFGIGPLLPMLMKEGGPEELGNLAFWHPEGWEGQMKAFKFRNNDISGAFFEAAARSYLRQMLVEGGTDSASREAIVDFLKFIYQTNLKPATLYLTSLAIVHFDKNSLDNSELQAFTLSFIGDTNSPKWRQTAHLSANEKATVEKARDTLEHWINELFLDRFWSLIDDPRRRRFWKRHQKRMRDVRIAISDQYYASLPVDLKKQGFLKRIHATTGNALLIFRIGNRHFIEFGERASGPLQVIVRDSQQESYLEKTLLRTPRTGNVRTPINPQQLKFYSSSEQFLVKDGRYFNYGKLNHSGNWETNLDTWFRQVGNK